MLRDLHRIGEDATALYLRTFSPQDKELPVAFKQLVKNIDGSTVFYNKYSFTITVNYSGQRIFFPNQLWYIAAYFTEYYNALDEYVKIIKGELNISDDSIKKAKDNERYATEIISPTHFDDDTKRYLIRFLSDYKWWYGGKGIERADYYVSPILSLSKLVNASQSYLAELSKYLSKNVEAQEILSKIINEDNTGGSIVEISKTTEHSGGMPAMLALSIKEALTIDSNLHLLSSKWMTNKDGDRLNIGTLNFAVEINKASTLREGDTNKSVTWEWNGTKFCISNEISFHRFKDYINAYNETYSGRLKIVVTEENGKNIYTLYRINRQNQNLLDTAYTPYLTALRTKPFMLLAGISGTGKSCIVREMAKACWKDGDPEFGKNHPKNFCMVQVKPNWHDSSELIGYVSRLNGEKFVVGPFLRFLAAAIKEPEVPYFLCLDEMNLAPVEQYFAEYLSVIESRKLNPDGTITTDPIIEYENTDAYGSLIDQLFDTPEERKAYKTAEGGKRLTIPQNFFVVGTVNMDETTFSFSRKVLDRAMTIEMNEVDLHGGLERSVGNEIGYIGNSIIGDAAEGCDIYEDNRDLCDQVLAYLEQVNAILEGTPFKIAYRTRNEFLMYAVNRKKLAPESQLWQTLDEMTSMKILSRIEGDEERIKKVLDGLKSLVEEQIVAQMPADAGETPALQSISAAKIEEMQKKLQVTGFTSYWA